MAKLVTFYHDIEQNIDSEADVEKCRNAVRGFLRLEKKYGVRATYNVVGRLFGEQPDLIGWILEAGQEVAFHSYNHQGDWNPKYYLDEVDLCKNISPLPKGYRSPRSKWDKAAVERMWEDGFIWNAEGGDDKDPYFIHQDLIRLPIAGDDWPLQTGAVNTDQLIEQFRSLLGKRLYVAFGFHDSVASFALEERLMAWEKILQIAIESKILCVTFSEAADLYLRAAQSKGIKLPYRNLKIAVGVGHRTIPLSAVKFNFPNRWQTYLKMKLSAVKRWLHGLVKCVLCEFGKNVFNLMDKVGLSKLIFNNGFIRHAIVRNAFWLTISMGISTLVSLIVVISLARHYGPSGYGQWAFALAFVNFFSVLVEFGFETLMIREISRDKTKTSEYVENIIALKAAFSLVAIVFIFIIINLIRNDPVVLNLVYLLGFYMVINSFNSLFQTVFRANEKMYYETVCYLLQGLLLAGLVFFFIFNNFPINYIAYVYIGVASFGSIFSLFLVWRYFSKFFFRVNILSCKKIFLEVWAYALSSIVLSFYVIDTILLGVMRSDTEVGWYSAAYRVPLFVQVLGLIIWRGFFPQLSQRYKQGNEHFKPIIEKLAKVMHFFAWPLAFGGVILSGKIIVLLFGQSYLPGKLAFEILICAMSLSFIASIYQEPIKASDSPKVFLLGVSVGAAVNIIFNILLIPYFGLNGAAAAFFIAQICFTLFMYFQLNKIVRIRIYNYMGIPLVSSIIMSLFICLVLNWFNVLFIVALGAVVYAVVYFLISLSLKIFFSNL